MSVVYSTIFTLINDSQNTVLVEVPALDIQTQGFGIANAIEMARDAIGLKVLTMEAMGICIPEDTVLDLNQSEFKNEGTQFTSFVDVNMSEFRKKNDNKTVRRNVTLPNWLNLEAEKSHINVSRVLQEALMQKLGC